MMLSDREVEKLKKTLLKEGMKTELYSVYDGSHWMYLWKGFGIEGRERVLYSKNPLKSIPQGISALFKKREYPPTEYFLVIKKVPHPIFNHLLNKGTRVEYPTKLEKETKKEFQNNVFEKVITTIRMEIFDFFQATQP